MWFFEVLDKLKSVNIQEMFYKKVVRVQPFFIVNTNSKKKLDIVKF